MGGKEQATLHGDAFGIVQKLVRSLEQVKCRRNTACMTGENQLGRELTWGKSSVGRGKLGDGEPGEQMRRDQELACMGEGWQRHGLGWPW